MEGIERATIGASKARLQSDESVSGVVLELFECYHENKEIKEGHISRPTNIQQVNFVLEDSTQLGHIQMKDRSYAKFWIRDASEQERMQSLVAICLKFQKKGVLKPLVCVETYRDNVKKLIVGCQNFDCTFTDWVNQTSKLAIPVGPYLSHKFKDIIRSGLTAIDDICDMGFTCVDLNKTSSYVMIGTYLVILPFVIHRQTLQPDEERYSMRLQFADMLDEHIFPLANNLELKELTSFMRNRKATSGLILRHPVLSEPLERQLLYRDCFSLSFTSEQLNAIKEHIIVDPSWKQIACHDPGLNEIIGKHYFTDDIFGALHFAKIVACHYLQNLMNVVNWQGGLDHEFVDKLLTWCLPLLLCRFYALKSLDSSFKKLFAC